MRQSEISRDTQTVIKVGDDFYVVASALTSRRPTRVLANGESFAVFEFGGDIIESPLEPLGFFHRDTRYLSRFELRIAGETPYLLNSYTSNEGAQLRINLSNPDFYSGGDVIRLPRNSLQIERNWALGGDATLFHKVIVRNYTLLPLQIPLDFMFGVDFADLFEVRGLRRKRRGEHDEPVVDENCVRFSYRGLDQVRRVTDVVFEPRPVGLDATRAWFLLPLNPGEELALEVRITGGSDTPDLKAAQAPLRFDEALALRRAEIATLSAGWSPIRASNELMDGLLSRSAADLTAIIRYAPEGAFMQAGIPWFATLFGRDSLITALFALPFNPAIAVGTLKTLASLQGSEVSRRRDEEPGKIVHEIRGGEMAATGEVPFGRYYGSVDSTPLFLWLLGRYVATTADLGLAAKLWPNVERALEWIERWGDRDGDLYVEYLRETPRGLANQGWKDSFDAISHADGTLARPPIALCEVQGYVYAAYQSIADVARRLGHVNLADRLEERAAALRAAFARDFWLDGERTVALALDADKKPCRVMTSNAGHCLATGLLDRDRALAVAERLLAEEMFTGWGVRTLSAGERRYNPMSYHNGSVWPHDNALVAAGLARFGLRQSVLTILEGLLDASVHLHTGSLPELFCGFPRDVRLGPVPYPVACHPQAWSAASVFMLVQGMLGMEVLGFEQRLIIDSPALPRRLDWLKIEDLRVGQGKISFIVHRTSQGAAIEILKRQGEVSVEVKK
ncbi:MAG TPA: glycogen debranching N-terminal domain-containing protein [Candidatus Acidoferrales bacterium]|nr:glycogen debranching N-terminal domain-containing protein [Candidatus Acidoferrales bacterium]